MIRYTSLVVVLATSLNAPAMAREPAFVSPDQSNAFQILPTPPAADSDITKAELAELHRIEATRTQAEVARAKLDDENENIFLFKDVMGERFNKDDLPLTAAFATRVRGDESVNTEAAKTGFHRPRPYNLDKTLHPVCKTKAKDDAYPSGHATSGFLLALTLIDMVPERRDAILARAEEYGHNRLICGVHYSTDVPASKLLAYTIHAIMEVNPRYQQELATAKTELRRVPGTGSASDQVTRDTSRESKQRASLARSPRRQGRGFRNFSPLTNFFDPALTADEHSRAVAHAFRALGARYGSSPIAITLRPVSRVVGGDSFGLLGAGETATARVAHASGKRLPRPAESSTLCLCADRR